MFEEILRKIENEWEISFTGENDIRSDFLDESDKDSAYLDIYTLSNHVFSVLERIGKIPQEHPDEEYDKRYREEYAAMLNKARSIILDALGSSVETREISSETELKGLGTFFQGIKIYDKLQRLEEGDDLTYVFLPFLCFSIGLLIIRALTQQIVWSFDILYSIFPALICFFFLQFIGVSREVAFAIRYRNFRLGGFVHRIVIKPARPSAEFEYRMIFLERFHALLSAYFE